MPSSRARPRRSESGASSSRLSPPSSECRRRSSCARATSSPTSCARNPLGDVATDPKRYQVSFLSAQPDPRAVREIAAVDVAPEEFVVSGREVFAWHPNGIQRSPLAKLLSERRLGVAATARNWSTVTKLLALADE